MSNKFDFKKIFEVLGKMEKCVETVSRLNSQMQINSAKKAA